MIYEILDINGNVSDIIMADEAFVLASYPDGNYRLAADQSMDEPDDPTLSDPAAYANVLESARTQNILTNIGDGIWPTRLESFKLMDRWVVNTAHGELSVGDVVISLSKYNVAAPNPVVADGIWTSIETTIWVKIFDAATNFHVRTPLTTAIDTNFSTLEESGVVHQTSSSRTVERRVLDDVLNESTATAIETRIVQASHIYPYQTIFDSGWI
jgi:hypothetical protein